MKEETVSDFEGDIDLVRAEFEEWRSQRVGRPPIPKTLWAKAVSLLDRYPISTVSRELHLNSKRLSENRDGNPKAARRRRNRTQATVSESLKSTPQFLQLTVNEAACDRPAKQKAPRCGDFSVSMRDSEESRILPLRHADKDGSISNELQQLAWTFEKIAEGSGATEAIARGVAHTWHLDSSKERVSRDASPRV